LKGDIRLVAVKITNDSGRDLVFGKDISLTYLNGSEVYILDYEDTYKKLEQSPTSHLFYLLLTPLNVFYS